MASFDGILLRVDLFLLVMARISGFIMLMPVLSNRFLIGKIKVILVLALSLLVFMVLNLDSIPPPEHALPYLFALLGEWLIGAAMGMVTQLVFAAVQTAGLFIDMQLGFGMVNVIDPLYGQQIPITGNFLNLLAIMLWLGYNGHHLLIEALVKSYHWIPIFAPGLEIAWLGPKLDVFLRLFSALLVTAFKIAMPIVGTLFIVDFALGIVARAVPQVNVFVVGFIIKIFAGFALLIIVLPMYLNFLERLYAINLGDLLQFIGAGR